MSKIRLETAIQVLQYAIEKKVLIKEALAKFGLNDAYLRKKRERIKQSPSYKEDKDYREFLELYDQATQKPLKRTISGGKVTSGSTLSQVSFLTKQYTKGFSDCNEDNARILGEEVIPEAINPELIGIIQSSIDDFKATGHVYATEVEDANTEDIDKYAERNKVWINRDSTGKIVSYGYTILVRDDAPLEGELTRTEMENIHFLYPYNTVNGLSEEFPLLTPNDLQRILRAFNITKQKAFPQHLLEEWGEDRLAGFALKAKDKAAKKRIVTDRPTYLEKRLREAEDALRVERGRSSLIKGLIAEGVATLAMPLEYKPIAFSSGAKKGSEETQDVYGIFGDVHFGKYYNSDLLIHGRGTSRQILEERFEQMGDEIAEEYMRRGYPNKDIHLVCSGDIFESILPEGMHPQHTERMDEKGKNQFNFGLKTVRNLLARLRQVMSPKSKLFLHGIGGNHDRGTKGRDDDKARLVAGIFYDQLQEFSNLMFDEGQVEIINYGKIMRFANNNEGLSILGHHGDAFLSKRTALELMNQFKRGDSQNYTFIFTAHLHNAKEIESGTNFTYMRLPSMCSTDEYALEELGKGAQPGFVIGTRARNKAYGFDTKVVTLY